MKVAFLTEQEEKKFERCLPRSYQSYIFKRIERVVICPECGATEHEIIMFPPSIGKNMAFGVGIIHFCPYCGVRGNGDNPYWYFVQCQSSPRTIENAIAKIAKLGCPICHEYIPKELLEDAFGVRRQKHNRVEQFSLSF